MNENISVSLAVDVAPKTDAITVIKTQKLPIISTVYFLYRIYAL